MQKFRENFATNIISSTKKFANFYLTLTFYAKNFKNQVKYGIIKAWKTV